MSGFKGITKGGWHPGGKGEGGKESWRGDFKGINTVSGWKNKAMGRSAAPGKEDPHEHVSAPLSTLKDPASFGPPPKHRAYYGDAAGPPPPPPRATREQEEARRREEEEANRPPAGPYTADTTGLSTAHLPKPPAFRPSQTPPPAVELSTKPKPKPSLPPRLPPRQNSHPDAYAPAPPPTYNEATQDSDASAGYLNQGALNRLGQAGVAVPGLDIGRNASPPVPPRRTASPAAASPTVAPSRNNSQMNELQSRFSNMRTSSSPSSPSTGTTWAEKQAALRTASNLQKDPSKVTLSDARSAASTANNFRERHGEQVAAGWRSASNLNQKYDITGRINSLASGSKASPPPSPTTGSLGKKPPPPPPPPKKKELSSGMAEPPPIPLGSKPKF
ncbi:hypothetical protein BU23DRAFT_594389 [Bimuria novae-zelandiae CBS 107.79]|uniref:Uncharacterized protein n=1 Tax=Bimuria novae-zelandiae CBS 107.79 TaxID=1447943 RepID=A0A6A5VS05_9PLEO|nr:hypothetical protein BU23DRAFT_594389 [Bimuria novae-zelandiae CBS 107.79]